MKKIIGLIIVLISTSSLMAQKQETSNTVINGAFVTIIRDVASVKAINPIQFVGDSLINAAKFTVTNGGYNYQVSIPDNIGATNGVDSISVSTFQSQNSIGGSIKLNPNQISGDYKGSFEVIIFFE